MVGKTNARIFAALAALILLATAGCAAVASNYGDESVSADTIQREKFVTAFGNIADDAECVEAEILGGIYDAMLVYAETGDSEKLVSDFIDAIVKPSGCPEEAYKDAAERMKKDADNRDWIDFVVETYSLMEKLYGIETVATVFKCFFAAMVVVAVAAAIMKEFEPLLKCIENNDWFGAIQEIIRLSELFFGDGRLVNDLFYTVVFVYVIYKIWYGGILDAEQIDATL